MEIKKTTTQSEAIKIIVEDNGEVIGRVYLYLIKNDLHEVPYGLMEDVFVEPGYRGKRIGSTLIAEVIEEAKRQGCYKLIGQSRYLRKDVHAMYQKYGFKDYGKNFRMNF